MGDVHFAHCKSHGADGFGPRRWLCVHGWYSTQRPLLSLRNVTSDLTCRARFTPIVYTAYLLSNPRYLIPDEGHNAPYGSPTVFSVPKVVNGYTFSSWSGCAGAPTTTKWVGNMQNGMSFETATITGSVQCVANYVPTKK
jgi:hypothetical protein